jgi:hypothetical protein
MRDADLERAGIKIDETWRGVDYVGPRAAMIAAGMVTAEQIPGDPACPRTKAFHFERDGRPFTVSFSARKGTVKLRASRTTEGVRADDEAFDARLCGEWGLRATATDAPSRGSCSTRSPD